MYEGTKQVISVWYQFMDWITEYHLQIRIESNDGHVDSGLFQKAGTKLLVMVFFNVSLIS